MTSPIVAVKRSNNVKTGKVAATYASQASCPSVCPLRNSGCYAESGHMAFTTRRLNASDVIDPDTIAEMEASAIRALPSDVPLRVPVHGAQSKRVRAAIA